MSVEVKAEEPSLLSRKFFDEMRSPDGTVRHAYAALAGLLDNLSIDSLVTKQNALRRRSGGSASPSRSTLKVARPSG